MEQASACHFGMALWVATLNIPVQYAKTTGHDSKGKRKPQTPSSDH